jgi:hypothetical protein
MMRELQSNLADLVASGDMTAEQANEWANDKAEQWAAEDRAEQAAVALQAEQAMFAGRVDRACQDIRRALKRVAAGDSSALAKVSAATDRGYRAGRFLTDYPAAYAKIVAERRGIDAAIAAGHEARARARNAEIARLRDEIRTQNAARGY